jgi:ATP-binding cassette subfamily B protein
MDADQILVLSHGRVVERGTHRQLLDVQGEYARMWALQQQRAQAEAVLEDAAAL